MITYISLGSNLDDPYLQLQEALFQLQQVTDIQLLCTSDFYQSRALTLPDSAPQNDYINAVAQLETSLSAHQLLQQLNKIEALQGRERKNKWSARTLDLDILLYDGQIIETESLNIPHAQIKYRNFVIHPLFEIAGAIIIPGLGDLAALAKKMNWDGLQKMNLSERKTTNRSE